jgi:putative hydroxymethylpyrimidine transport system substrate-binding protein
MKSVRLIALLVAAIALLAGCGGGADGGTTDASEQALEGVYVELDGRPSPENVGILMAQHRGYFADAGLSVDIYTAGGPAYPIHYALDGAAEFAIANQPQIVLAQEKGLPIVAVGSLLPQPTAAMIWLKKSGIEGIADLKGKTIAIPGVGFQKGFLKVILGRAGLKLADVKLKTVGYDLVPSLEKGKADAIFGGSGNVEGAELETRGLDPVVTRVQDLGVPDYEELVLATSRDYLSSEGWAVRAFMSAVTRGTAAAIEDPEEAVKAIKEDAELNPEFSRKATEAGLEATLPLLSTSGEMSAETAAGLVDWMHGRGLIQRQLPVSELLSNRFVP